MSCQLGRVTGIESPNSIRQDGDVLRVGGEFAYDNPVTATALAMQILGYPNVDEPVVPFIYSATQANGLLDGFYVVESTEVDFAKLAAGLFSWSAQLARVTDFRSPMFEVLSSGALRANAHSITTATALGWAAIPDAATSRTLVDDAGVSTTQVSGEVGVVATFTESGTSSLYDTSLTFSIPAASAYLTAATILSGSRVASSSAPVVTSHGTVVGRQGLSSATGWMLANDFVRFLPGPNTGEYLLGIFQDSTHGGADTWAYKSYKLTNGTTPSIFADPVTATILRNSPECCAVRVWMPFTSTNGVYADFTLRRGQTWIEGMLAEPYDSTQLGVFRFSSEAGTSVTGGLTATGDDAAGNKYLLRSASAVTKDTTQGGIYLTAAAATMSFAIGTDFLATNPNLATAYWAAMSHRQRIVAR